MKSDKLIPGLILVVIGAAILLANYGYLHFHWWNVFRLWPIFLVIGGVNLVFAHNKSPWATILKIAVVVLGLGLLFFGNFGDRYNFWPGHHYSWHSDDNDNDDSYDDDDDDSNHGTAVKMTGKGDFNEPYSANIKIARLNISGGGTTYTLNDTTNQLFAANTKDGDRRYELSQSKDDSVYVLDFHMKDHHGFNFDSDKNAAIIRLNQNPEWEIKVETGATSLNFDLSKFKIKELNLSGGFEALKVKLGLPIAMTNVDVSTGFSGVDISIPKDAACSIESDSGLSGNDFPGFIDKGDNKHETPGYDSAKNKIYIHISGGLSGFKVSRY